MPTVCSYLRSSKANLLLPSIDGSEKDKKEDEIGLHDYVRRRIGSIRELISGPDRIPLLYWHLL